MKILVLLVLFGSSLGQCPSNDRHCAYCILTQCQICYDALLSNGVCISTNIKKNSNCWTSNGFDVCTRCNYGYYVDPSGLCVPVLISAYLTETCSTANCYECNSSGACISCNGGFALNASNQCIEIPDELSNCLKVEGSTCVQCRYNYFWNNGICEPTRGDYTPSGSDATLIMPHALMLLAMLITMVLHK